MMSLRAKQEAFAVLQARLVLEIHRQGYGCTLGEAWRPPEMVAIYAKRGTGSKASLHPDRLAIDLNLFKDGVYLPRTEDHRQFGLWWEAQSTPDVTCVWGGSWGSDGNHYAVQHGNRK